MVAAEPVSMNKAPPKNCPVASDSAELPLSVERLRVRVDRELMAPPAVPARLLRNWLSLIVTVGSVPLPGVETAPPRESDPVASLPSKRDWLIVSVEPATV